MTRASAPAHDMPDLQTVIQELTAAGMSGARMTELLHNAEMVPPTLDVDVGDGIDIGNLIFHEAARDGDTVTVRKILSTADTQSLINYIQVIDIGILRDNIESSRTIRLIHI